MFHFILLRAAIASAAALIGIAAIGVSDPPLSGATTNGPAVAKASSTIGPFTLNCGIVTCSGYLSRSATKAAYAKSTVGAGGFAAAATVVCGAAGAAFVPLGIACAAVAAAHGPWIAQELQDAATQHGAAGACLKVTFTKPLPDIPPTITWWSTNNGKYCKD